MIEVTTTREQWLQDAATAIREQCFAPNDIAVPPIHVSVGWPGGRGKKDSVIGQCWATTASTDKTAHVFISPVLHRPINVLETLVHEMVHAADDCKTGHRGAFARMAKSVGLTGKMTSTVAGKELKATLQEIGRELGPFPHAALRQGGPGKQSTRMLKVQCPDCDYTVRTTQKWLDQGLPTCPCGTEMEKA